MFNAEGDENGINLKKYHHVRNNFRSETSAGNKIFTHNHPDIFMRELYLSPADIGMGIKQGYREIRAVSEDGFCHLVEIPGMHLIKKKHCYLITQKYEISLDSIIDSFNRTYAELTPSDKVIKETNKRILNHIKEMNKLLERTGGLKFRKLKLP